MIEIEKKFQPTDEQLKALLEGAEFLGEKLIHDTYYDYSDFRLFKNLIRLRNRDGSFELKIGKSGGIAEEIETKGEIERYFHTSNLEDFIETNLVKIIDFKNNRKKYKKEDFIIDLDEMDFGFKVCEIELLVEKDEDIKKAEERILSFAQSLNLEVKKLPEKREEYLRIFKPEIYSVIYNK